MPSEPKNIQIADYDYPLPDERIAKYPLAQRDQSKLLIYKKGDISESRFFHLAEQLPAESLLVCNNTKVIHARLLFQKSTGATIEIFCLEPYAMPVATAFEQRERCTWTCFIGNNKKWKSGPLTLSFSTSNAQHTITASRREAVGNAWIVDLEWTGGLSFAEVIEAAGVIPLPPYLHRDATDDDKVRYQTVYAREQGSVAAPTAGLHFTDAVFESLRKTHIDCEFVTLHVGAGTFKPVDCAAIGDHEMHVEKVEISQSNISCSIWASR